MDIKISNIDSRLPHGDMSGILLRECNWSVKTAGPSPDDNNRTELFLLGCNKAMLVIHAKVVLIQLHGIIQKHNGLMIQSKWRSILITVLQIST